MRRLTDISRDSVSILLPVYSYYSVLVSGTFLDEATKKFLLVLSQNMYNASVWDYWTKPRRRWGERATKLLVN